MPISEKLLETRLQGVQLALGRARYAYFASVIAAVAVFVPVWNYTFSWTRGWAFRTQWSTQSEVTAEAQKQLLTDWVHNLMVNIPLMGTRIGIDDIAVLGSTALFLFSLWFLNNAKRANCLMNDLLVATSLAHRETKELVFHAILPHMTFATVTPTGGSASSKSRIDLSLGFWFKLLFFLPSAAILIIILMDALTIFVLPAPFRIPHKRLLEAMSGADLNIAGTIDAYALAALIGVTVIAFKSIHLVKQSVDLLHSYQPASSSFEEAQANEPNEYET